MASANIHDYIAPGRRAHLVGIGGVSMSPLAEVLHKAGMVITGSDMRNSATVEHLRALGIPVAIGHRGENVQGAELVIRTAAVHDENPEIAAARAAGIPVFERAQAWGAIMRGYKNALCIAGTHGKTTTTSMCTHIIMAARMDPTVMIGGTLPLLGSGYRVGHGDTIILESCEYCNSFLSFFPTVAVILNIEADHLDFFKDLDDVEHSFRAFADRVPESGIIVANADDANTMHTLEGEERPVLTFGLEQGDVRAANLAWNRGLPSFDVVYRGDVFTHVALRVPGEHNVKNALAAAAAAIALRWSRRPSPRAWPPSGGRAAASSTRAPTTGRRCTTTTPTTPVSSTPCSPPPAPWAMSGSSAPSSPTPIPAPTPCSTTLWRRSARPTSPFWRRSTPPARSTTSASPPRIWRRASPAVSTMPRCPR